jgi:ABC-type Na+ efflux pump permease subunit
MYKRKNPILVIAKRQLASLRNEKTILFAILVQLFVALFSSFLVVGIVAVYDPSGVEQGRTITVGLSGDYSDGLREQIEDSNSPTNILDYESRESAIEAFEEGRISAVIHTSENDEGQVIANVVAPEKGLSSTLVVVRTQSILENFGQNLRQERSNQIKDVQTIDIDGPVSSQPPFTSFIYTVLIPLLLFLPSFISGAIVIDSIIEDKKTGMMEMLRTSPISSNELVIGKLLTPLLLGPVQIFVWLVLLNLNGISIDRPEIIILIGAGLTGIAIGCAVSVTRFFQDRGLAQFAYSSVLVLILGLSTLLPELPTTTIARLGLGSYDQVTLGLSAVYLIAGLVFVVISVYNFKPILGD